MYLPNVFLHHIARSAVFILGIGCLCACGYNAKSTHNPALAANIYTDLASYYWQMGYQDLALDRLNEALRHNPNHTHATELFSQWQNTSNADAE